MKLYVFLKNERKEFHLSSQLVKSGTSIGANIEAAIGGSSRKDCKAKQDIAYKEARETRYWIKLFWDCDLLEKELATSLICDCEELIRLLSAIIKTLKSSQTKNGY